MATTTTVEEMGFRVLDLEMRRVTVVFRGGRRFRNAVLNGLIRAKVNISQFVIDTRVPYNGCRLEKKQRK